MKAAGVLRTQIVIHHHAWIICVNRVVIVRSESPAPLATGAARISSAATMASVKKFFLALNGSQFSMAIVPNFLNQKTLARRVFRWHQGLEQA